VSAVAPQAMPDEGPYRVMVVDDSAVVRGIVKRWLEADPTMVVAASCGDGAQALRKAETTRCDVIVLDVEMPNMDGLAALPALLRASPGVRVIMSSTRTRRNAEISLKALSLGASDYVAKPQSLHGAQAVEDFRRELTGKVKAIAEASRRRRSLRRAGIAPAGRRDEFAAQASRGSFALRPLPHENPAIIAIGSSTGGPQALFDIGRTIGPALDVPVLVAQHMPGTFTTILAEHLARYSGRPCVEGAAGETIVPGHIYVAPGEHHMEVDRDAKGAAVIQINENPPENFCRPAADALFRSVARTYGRRALGLVLTGMGVDGRDGARAIVEAGGAVLAQDEATSVVWGMPGAVAMAGLASAVLPLADIGPAIGRLLRGGADAA
jgi:two-component system, chemotaxis family, protein-glutamate methylesterase/glutaminase